MARKIEQVIVLLILALLLAGPALGASAPTMREKVYSRLSKAQEAADEGHFAKAYEHLEKIEKMKNLSPNEAAQLYTAFGYTYFSDELYADSAAAYEKVLQQKDLPEGLQTSTMYTLGQLYFHLEDYDKSLSYLQDWLKVATNPAPEAYIMLAQANYQAGKIAKAADPVWQAIEVAQERGKEVEENWYGLLRAIYFETKDYDKLLDVLEVLVTRWPAKEYWLHLSSVYGETDRPLKQLASYEMAHVQGYLEQSSELVLLAQLLMQAGVPYRAGEILQEGLDAGSVESTANNWRLLSQAWILSQEHEASIVSLTRAAELSDDGELYARIAQSYASLDEWGKAAAACATAVAKGVENAHEVHMLQGMAFFEMEQFGKAKGAFREAQRTEEGRDGATKWLAYVEREEQRLQEMGVQ